MTTSSGDRAGQLTDALNLMSRRLEEVKRDSEDRDKTLAGKDEQLARYGRRNRVMIWVTIVSLALDLLLTAGLAVVSVQARDAASSAAASSQAQMALCQASNVARAQQVELWDYVIGLSAAKKPQTASQRQTTVAFAAHLRKLFAPRDCAHLSG